MMTWTVIGMVVGLAGLLWLVYDLVLCRSSSERILHFRKGVCEEYYWMDFPIWEKNRRPYGTQGVPEHYSFRYAVIAIVLAVVSIAC